MIKPKLIICEGRKAFECVTKFALEEKVEINHSDVYYYSSEKLKTNILGFSRKLGGGIKDKELLKSKIKELIK